MLRPDGCIDLEPRLTTVHDRYHIIGYCPEPELSHTEMRLADALAEARRLTGYPHYDRCEVYDNMARRGKPQLWSSDGKVLEVRK